MKRISFSAIQMIVLLCTVATGFSGLVYEVTWHRYMHNIAGSEARATAIILAVFLGGLSLGYEVFGRWSKKRSSYENLKAFGFAELGIGCWAVLFDYIYRFGFQLSTDIGGGAFSTLAGELLVAAVIMGPPTVLMGGTLPLLTQGLSGSIAKAHHFHARVYALNTLGAFGGCLIAGFFLLPTLGLPLTMIYMSMINLSVGFFIIVLSKKLQFSDAADADTKHSSENQASLGDNQLKKKMVFDKEFINPVRGFFIAFMAGFYSISLQTIFVRMTGLTMGASEYAFSMIVSLFILMLALGAWGIGKRDNINLEVLRRNQIFITLGGLFVYVTIPYWPYVNHLIRILFSDSKIAFWGYFAFNFILLGLVLSLLLGAMGRTMPLLFSTSELKSKTLGKRVGDLYGINSLGCMMGALLGGYLLFYWFNLDSVFKLCIVLMSLTIVLSHSNKNLKSSLTIAAASILCVVVLTPWNKSHFGFGLFRMTSEIQISYDGKESFYQTLNQDRKLKAYGDGPNGTIAVFAMEKKKSPKTAKESDKNGAVSDMAHQPKSEENSDHSAGSKSPASQTQQAGGSVAEQKNDPSKMQPSDKQDNPNQTDTNAVEGKSSYLSIVVNGKSDGATSGDDVATTRVLAHLPALLNEPTTGEAAVIGFGTGITVGNLALYDHLKSIDCIELSENVRKFSPLFSEANLDVTKNPKFHWIAADAYRALLSSHKTYDIIVSEPSNPWVTGVERLYSQDFYQLIKDKLSPTGIYAQWFHTYSISQETLSMVFKTYHSVFPHIYTFSTASMDLIILGSMNALDSNNLALMDSRIKNKQIIAPLKELQMDSSYALLSREIWNDPEIHKDAAIHSLDFPKLAYSAGKDFFQNKHLLLNSMVEVPEFLKNLINFALRTLFSMYDSMHRSSIPLERQRQITAICGVEKLSDISRSWLKTARPCRSAMYLAFKNKIIDPKNFDDFEARLIKEKSPDVKPMNSAISFLWAYERVHSTYSPIETQMLLDRTKICQTEKSPEGDYCRSRLLSTLRRSSEDDLAEKLEKQMRAAGLGGTDVEKATQSPK